MQSYEEFIKNKLTYKLKKALTVEKSELNPILFEYQKDIVKWALNLGKAAVFSATGTGKTFMELEFGRIIFEKTNSNVLIVCPLAVSLQTIKEGKKLNIEVNNLRKNEHKNGLNIINYEYLHNIDYRNYNCVILDESSILKNFSGKIRNELIDNFSKYDYKLCATATPSPNDYEELGNHSEFLDVMKRLEMLATFFIHDAGDTGKWRLKGHTKKDFFWRWVSSWACVLTKASDLGYSDNDYKLPKLNEIEIKVEVPFGKSDDFLFDDYEITNLSDRRKNRKMALEYKIDKIVNMVNNSDDIWLIWTDFNIEGEILKSKIKDCVEVKGSDSNDFKEKSLIDFSEGKIKCLITKPKIAGFGMNWQICHNMIYVGISDSFEQYFQSVRRCWRYGQKNEVNVYIFSSNIEESIMKNLNRKKLQFDEMIKSISKHTNKYIRNNLLGEFLKLNSDYNAENNMILPNWLRSEE